VATVVTLLAAAVATAVLTLRGVNLKGHNLTIPSRPPPSLLGQPANPGALSQNSDWSSLASQVARGSTVSFASVYGPYPVRQLPTTDTFLVVAGEPNGGNRNIPNLMRREMTGVRSSFSGQAGSRVAVGPLRQSVEGGQMQCVSAVVSPAIVGECLWLSPSALVQVVTFTNSLPTVSGMTERIVEELAEGKTAAGSSVKRTT
jgi:hypothetical protein